VSKKSAGEGGRSATQMECGGSFGPSHGLGKRLVWLRSGLGQSKCFLDTLAPGSFSPHPSKHSTVAMELQQRYKPLCLSQKDGHLLPSADLHPFQTSALDCPNPQSPSSTTSCAKSDPLSAFAPPLWLLYLCRSFGIEASDASNFDSNSSWQAFGTATLRKANSPPIPLPQNRRRHFHSIAAHELSPTPENPPRDPFE
jgi:hypothetical protein